MKFFSTFLLALLVAVTWASPSVSGTSCNNNLGVVLSTLQCASVATNILGVRCISDLCTCVNGFGGSATSTSKCACNSPDEITTQDGTVFCMAPAAQEIALQAEEDACAVYAAKVTQLYSFTVFPFPIAISTGAFDVAEVGIFDINAKIRVDGAGFTGQKEVIEYFYGFGVLSPIVSFYMSRILCDPVQHKVFSSADLLFSLPPGSGSANPIYNLTEWLVSTFDPVSQLIISMDATVDEVVKVDTPGTVTPPSPARLSLITEICEVYSLVNPLTGTSPGVCADPTLDPLGRYVDFDDCVNTMSSYENWGTYAKLNANSTTCRITHAGLAIGDPVTHCPHVGRTGGGACVDQPFDIYYTQGLY